MKLEYSRRFKLVISAEVPKDKRFTIPVHGEARTVVSIKLSRSHEEDSDAQVTCALLGKGVPRFFSVKMEDLPAWLQEELRTEYQAWIESVPKYEI